MTPQEARIEWVGALIRTRATNVEILRETLQVIIDAMDIVEQSEEERILVRAAQTFDGFDFSEKEEG